MKEELKAFYFPHDIGASNDPKLIDLRMRFGWEAIGMYWAIIEALHKEENGEMPSHLITSMILDFYSQEEIRTMSHKREHAKDFEECLYTNVLLERISDNITTNKRVKKNIEERRNKSEMARKSIEARWHKSISGNNLNTNELRTNYERNTIKESKVKEIKESKTQEGVWFEEIWNQYPKRLGKKEAFKHFKTSVLSEGDLASIKTALKHYMGSAAVARGFVQNGSTWFNNWRDWINPPPDFTPKIYGYTNDKKPVTELQIAKLLGMVK